MRRASSGQNDRGETLIELIVALAILSIAAVAILSGVMLSIKTSAVHRHQATGGAYVRSFAEAIQNHVDANGYTTCGSAASSYAAVTVPDLPAGYTKSVTAVQSWTGSAWGTCSTTGIQRVDLKVTSPGGASHGAEETLVVILRRPCNGPALTSSSDPCA